MNIKIFRHRFLALSLLFGIFFIIACTIAGAVRHNYWSYVIYHKYPLFYLQIFLLSACFIFAAANFICRRYKSLREKIFWFLISSGFLYFTLDAGLLLHQQIRNKILKPNNISIDFLFWVEKGDYVLILLFLTGLIFTLVFLRYLLKTKYVFILFITAVVFAAISVFADSFDLHNFSYGFQKFLQYIEEICETFSAIFFMNSFLGALLSSREQN
jgi:hypothetical protein